MSNCCKEPVIAYRVVKTLLERNNIPCEERMEGMIVTVIGTDKSYKQYILRGEPCANSSWVSYGMDKELLKTYIGHITVVSNRNENITSEYLNSRFPEALEGFKVTFSNLNTTFMKIFDDEWIMSGNTRI